MRHRAVDVSGADVAGRRDPARGVPLAPPAPGHNGAPALDDADLRPVALRNLRIIARAMPVGSHGALKDMPRPRALADYLLSRLGDDVRDAEIEFGVRRLAEAMWIFEGTDHIPEAWRTIGPALSALGVVPPLVGLPDDDPVAVRDWCAVLLAGAQERTAWQ